MFTEVKKMVEMSGRTQGSETVYELRLLKNGNLVLQVRV